MAKIYKQVKNDYSLRRYIFYILFILIVADAVLYLFFINLGVSGILLKKQNLVQLRDLEEENQILEGKYLEEFKKIDLDYAYNSGYINADSSMFVRRTAPLAASR